MNNFKKKAVYDFLSSLLFDKTAQYNCCFAVVKRSKIYNELVLRLILIRLLLFLLFDVNFFVFFCETNFDIITIFSKLSCLKNAHFSWKNLYQWKTQTFL